MDEIDQINNAIWKLWKNHPREAGSVVPKFVMSPKPENVVFLGLNPSLPKKLHSEAREWISDPTKTQLLDLLEMRQEQCWYWNPFSENSNLIEDWFSYVKNVTLARYAADSIGRYIQETSADQIQAIDATGKKICGELYTGFSALEKQLGLVSNQLTEISDSLQGIDSRLGLLVDEAKTSNLLLENVAELLRIPESQKQRQYHIEMGLKFLKNALKDEDLYQDALTELLDAEKLMPSDYFVLHRIGMIYFFVPALGNLEKAAEYFTRAGKYAAVESDPNAARLSNILNKRVNKRFDAEVCGQLHP